MNKDELENIKLKLEDEYQNNAIKIDELNKKLDIFQNTKFTTRFVLGLVASIVFLFPITYFMKEIVILGVFTQPISVAFSILTGYLAEKIIYKRSKMKQKLNSVSQANNSLERKEEEVNCKIEKETLENKNIGLEKTIHVLSENEYLMDTLSNQYDVIEKKQDSKSQEELQDDMQKKNDLLKEKEQELEKITEKKVLKDEFQQIRNRDKGIEEVVDTLFHANSLAMFYTLSTFLTVFMGEKISFQNGVFSIFTPIAVALGTGAIYSAKKRKDDRQVFHNLNDKLKEDKLSDIEEEIEEKLELNLTKAIKIYAETKMKVESEKQKLKNCPSISDSTIVMDKFMKKLNNDEFSYDKLADENLEMDDVFIEQQLKNYEYVLSSPFFSEEQGPVLVKKKNN